MSALSPRDLALLAELGRLLDRRDPVPDDVRAAAELAGELLRAPSDWEWLDVLTDTTTLVRQRVGARLIRFGGNEITFDVELRRTGPSRLRLVGLIEPADGVGHVEVRWSSGAATVAPDELGYLYFEDLPAGPLRLVVHRPGRRSLATRWL